MKIFFSFLTSLLFLTGCSMQEGGLEQWLQPSENKKIKVLNTTAMIQELVNEVGGDMVSSLTLIRGELDPHSYQLVKGDDEKLAMADLIFCNGLGLEHGPSLRNTLESNPKAICLGNLIQKANPEVIVYLQNTPDPHIWMDMSLWEKGIPFIVEALSAKNPENADFYKQRGENLAKRMQEAQIRLQKEMHELPEEKRYLVTSHDAFNYFARAYLATETERVNGSWQKRFAAPEGLAPESQLSATDIRQILQHIKAYNIKVIFPESNVSQASIRKLLNAGNEEGLQLSIAPGPLYGDAMGPPGSTGDTYFKMIEHNVRIIKQQILDSGSNHNAHSR